LCRIVVFKSITAGLALTAFGAAAVSPWKVRRSSTVQSSVSIKVPKTVKEVRSGLSPTKR
jgi:hypothetical protein